MKKLSAIRYPLSAIFAALCLCAFVAVLSGCGTAPQRTYQTAATTEITVDATMTAWGNYVAQFHPSASEEMKVKAAFEKYQAAMLVAADAGKALAEGTGSQARLDIAVQTAAASLTDLVSLIQQFGVKIPTAK